MRSDRWRTWVLIILAANGCGLATMWLVLLFVQAPIFPPKFVGVECSPWEALTEYGVTIGELFFDSFPLYERVEAITLAVLTISLAGLTGWLISRLKPFSWRLAWRLQTVMITIAAVALTYAFYTSMWDVKYKWNLCLHLARYWKVDDTDLRYALDTAMHSQNREEILQVIRAEVLRIESHHGKYVAFLRNPFLLFNVSLEDIKTNRRDGFSNLVIRLPLSQPVQPLADEVR